MSAYKNLSTLHTIKNNRCYLFRIQLQSNQSQSALHVFCICEAEIIVFILTLFQVLSDTFQKEKP